MIYNLNYYTMTFETTDVTGSLSTLYTTGVTSADFGPMIGYGDNILEVANYRNGYTLTANVGGSGTYYYYLFENGANSPAIVQFNNGDNLSIPNSTTTQRTLFGLIVKGDWKRMPQIGRKYTVTFDQSTVGTVTVIDGKTCLDVTLDDLPIGYLDSITVYFYNSSQYDYYRLLTPSTDGSYRTYSTYNNDNRDLRNNMVILSRPMSSQTVYSEVFIERLP